MYSALVGALQVSVSLVPPRCSFLPRQQMETPSGLVFCLPAPTHPDCSGTESVTGWVTRWLHSLRFPHTTVPSMDGIHHGPTLPYSPHLIYALFQDNCLPARNIEEPDNQALQSSRSVADTDPRRLRLQPQPQPKARWHHKETEKGGHILR